MNGTPVPVEAPPLGACQVCASREGRVLGRKKSSRFVECAHCGLIRIDPLPSAQALAQHYQDYDLPRRLPKARRRVWRYRLKLLPALALARGRRFLDIGCHLGSMVEAARLDGCEAHGIELSSSVAEAAARLFPQCRFYNETLEAFAQRGLRFDIVHCTEVIEHITDLDSFMRALRTVCHPGAVLLFSTPDSGHFRLDRKNLLQWSELRSVAHVAVFNRRNIRQLFERHGFQPLFFFPALRPNLRFVSRFPG